MTLTIGVRTYQSNDGLRALTEDPDFSAALTAGLLRIAEGPNRVRIAARAEIKLKTWVMKDPAYDFLVFGAKGQGKSFSNFTTAVQWLLFKSEKAFAINQTTETELAKSINENDVIKNHVFEFLQGPLMEWWGRLGNNRQRIAGLTGNYSFYYSKLFLKRTIREGFEYFGADGGAFFSRTKTRNNFSMSEAAAFIADVAVRSKTPCGGFGERHVNDVQNIRYNETQIDQKTRAALDKAFRVLSTEPGGIYSANRSQTDMMDYLTIELGRTDNMSWVQKAHYVQLLLNAAIDELEKTIAEDKYHQLLDPTTVTVLQGTAVLGLARGLSLQGTENETETRDKTRRQVAFLRNPNLRVHLESQRPGGEAAEQLKQTLLREQPDPNKTPASLLNRNPQLHARVRKEGQDESERSRYNVDPDHAWTQMMITHTAVVGAGPSGTTSITLGLVETAERRINLDTEYAVAMALFAFWQRKKRLLKYAASVHTWNEVCAALHAHRPGVFVNKGYLQEVPNLARDYRLYNYPTGFHFGHPEFPAGVDPGQ